MGNTASAPLDVVTEIPETIGIIQAPSGPSAPSAPSAPSVPSDPFQPSVLLRDPVQSIGLWDNIQQPTLRPITDGLSDGTDLLLEPLNRLENVITQGNTSVISTLQQGNRQVLSTITDQTDRVTGAITSQTNQLTGAITGQTNAITGAISGQTTQLQNLINGSTMSNIANFDALQERLDSQESNILGQFTGQNNFISSQFQNQSSNFATLLGNQTQLNNANFQAILTGQGSQALALQQLQRTNNDIMGEISDLSQGNAILNNNLSGLRNDLGGFQNTFLRETANIQSAQQQMLFNQAQNQLRQMEANTGILGAISSGTATTLAEIGKVGTIVTDKMNDIEDNIGDKFARTDALIGRAFDSTNLGLNALDSTLIQTNRLVSDLDKNVALGALKTEMLVNGLASQLDQTRRDLANTTGGLADGIDGIGNTLIIGAVVVGGAFVFLQLNNKK